MQEGTVSTSMNPFALTTPRDWLTGTNHCDHYILRELFPCYVIAVACVSIYRRDPAFEVGFVPAGSPRCEGGCAPGYDGRRQPGDDGGW